LFIHNNKYFITDNHEIFEIYINKLKRRWVNAQAHLSTATKNSAVCWALPSHGKKCKSPRPDSRTACLITVTTQPGMLTRTCDCTVSLSNHVHRHKSMVTSLILLFYTFHIQLYITIRSKWWRSKPLFPMPAWVFRLWLTKLISLNILGWVVTVIKQAVLLSGRGDLHFLPWLGSAHSLLGWAHSWIFGSGGEMRLRVSPPHCSSKHVEFCPSPNWRWLRVLVHGWNL